ncbi:MAG: hypothetical protein L6Q99_19500 [Planctomycetes bacterium]|nr:hypothetical protein [Planctomycetota bacterium]
MAHKWLAHVPITLLISLPALAQSTTRVSVWTSGLQGNNASGSACANDDGSQIAFSSAASNWIPGDTNFGPADVFVYQRATGIVEHVSVSVNGTAANGDCALESSQALSADDRYVVFTSNATNLTTTPPFWPWQIYLRDRVAGVTTCVSTTPSGIPCNNTCRRASISADGTRVAFESNADDLVPGDTGHFTDVYVKDLTSGLIVRVSDSSPGVPASGNSGQAMLSRDGRYVVFASNAQDLVPGDTDLDYDIFRHDLVTGTTILVSVTDAGLNVVWDAMSPTVSADGNRIAWESRFPYVAADLNGSEDIFLRDVLAGTTTRVSLSSLGTEGNFPSTDGRISADGRYVSFTTMADNLFSPDTNAADDAVRYDTSTGTLELVGVSSSGAQAAFGSTSYGHSADNSVALFTSFSKGLIPGDMNQAGDVFVRDFTAPDPLIVGYCTAKPSSSGCVGEMSASGVASVAATSSFRLLAAGVPKNLNGIFFWGREPLGAPFLGGTLCVKPPLVRTAVSNTGSNNTFPPSTCQGATTYDFTHADMALHGVTSGETLYAQFWYRDPGYSPPNNVALTNALTFFVGP